MTLAEKIWSEAIGAFVSYGKTATGALKALAVNDDGELKIAEFTANVDPSGLATSAKQPALEGTDSAKVSLQVKKANAADTHLALGKAADADSIPVALSTEDLAILGTLADAPASISADETISTLSSIIALLKACKNLDIDISGYLSALKFGDQAKSASLSVTPATDIPAGRAIGKVTLDGPTAPIPVAISFASADAQTIIAAPASGYRIRITKLWVSCSANFIINIMSGANVIGNLYGMGADMDFLQPLTLNAAEAFKLDSNIATQTYGGVCYYIEAV